VTTDGAYGCMRVMANSHWLRREFWLYPLLLMWNLMGIVIGSVGYGHSCIVANACERYKLSTDCTYTVWNKSIIYALHRSKTGQTETRRTQKHAKDRRYKTQNRKRGHITVLGIVKVFMLNEFIFRMAMYILDGAGGVTRYNSKMGALNFKSIRKIQQ